MFKRNPDAIALIILVFFLTVGSVKVGNAGLGIFPATNAPDRQQRIVIGTGIEGIVTSLLQWIPVRRSHP